MKFFDRLTIVLFNICLLAVAIIFPALKIASTPAYYHAQFEKNGIYAQVDENGTERRTTIRYIGGNTDDRATFSDAQLNEMIDHIVDYLFTDKASFALVMDGVMLNGTLTDNVNIFGETAVTHMQDVKNLMTFAAQAAKIAAVAMAVLALYFLCRGKRIAKRLLTTTLGFYAVILLLAGAFFIWTYLATKNLGWGMEYFTTVLWRNVHYLFFPFQPEKLEGSFFNDTLTSILTLELFMTAVIIVLAIWLVSLTVWLVIAARIRKRIIRREELFRRGRVY